MNEIGLRNKIDQASGGHDYLGRYESLFAGRDIRHLAIVLGTRPVEIANTFAEFLPGATITAISYAPVDDLTRLRPNVRMHAAENIIRVHRALATASPYDVLIEDSPNRKSQKREIFRLFFPLVRDGGLYISEDLHASYIPSLLDDAKEDIWQLVNRLLMLKGSGGKAPARASADDLELAKAIDRVEFDGKFLAILSKGNKATKLRHGETNNILHDRYGETWGRVLETIETTVITSKALLTANKPGVAKEKFPNPINVPELDVREYYDVVALPRQILLKDSMLLPDTFRLGLIGRLNNTALNSLNHYSSWSPMPEEEPERLAGQYYYLDLEYNRHFGHFMTEAVPRLYAWDEAKSKNPDLKVLISSPTDHGALLPYQSAILNAYGIRDEDIHTFRAPVQVASLISPMPLFHNMTYVHPKLAETFARLGQNLNSGQSEFGDRIFVSRRPGMWRECLNMEKLEAVFVRHGFNVIYPEDLSIQEQATAFANAKVAAGYIGSALYSAMFSAQPMDIIGFVNTSYVATNEYFISTALNHRMHVFWCNDIEGNRDRDSKGRPLGTTNWDYQFDFGRDGALLEQLLNDL
ncbi:glycosyltransferase family 61 protein [Arthrobacter sp. UYCu723]